MTRPVHNFKKSQERKSIFEIERESYRNMQVTNENLKKFIDSKRQSSNLT